jgi:hypothetical protein
MGHVLVSGVEDHLAMQEMWKEWLQASVATPVSRVMSLRQIEQEEQDIVCWRLGGYSKAEQPWLQFLLLDALYKDILSSF